MIVQGLGLSSFYAMTAKSNVKPAGQLMSDYSVYDAEEFQRDFTSKLSAPDNSNDLRQARLLIEGITCYACIWLIRKATEKQFPGSQSNITINQSTGAAILTWDNNQFSLSRVVKFIETLGYQVLPHRGAAGITNQAALTRVGVGLFVMMNVMSFALADYFTGSDGIDPGLSSFFRWISLPLTTLSLAWTGREFFTNTWRRLKTRTPNIDGPILVGLMGAYVWSVMHTITAHGPVYYDSICAIVALVVTGRFVQQNVLIRNQARMAALVSPRDGWVLVKRTVDNQTNDNQTNDNQTVDWQPTRASSVKKNDVIRVFPGEMFPLRVTCATSCAEVSFEQLRGEIDWKTIQPGESIPAGALNGSSPIDVVAAQNGAESYTESLARSIDQAINDKGHYNKWSDRTAWGLFLVVFSVATVTFITVGTTNIEEAISRTVALLLVACPCTFAIGVPLTFGTAMTSALRDGILFKSQRALEKLAGIRHLVFDKTGTLTEGQISVASWNWSPTADDNTKLLTLNLLSGLDQSSSHHVAGAIASFARGLGGQSSERPTSMRESQGMGLIATFGANTIIVGRPYFITQNLITVSEDSLSPAATRIALNGYVVGSVTMDDTTRPESISLIHDLREQGFVIDILSGDSASRTAKIADELTINKAQAHGDATPASKLLFIRAASAKRPVVMIGNGLNDSGAMAHAEISIAVAGSSSAAMNSADICLLRPDISLIERAIRYAEVSRQRTRIVFGFALFYNILGLTLAALGHVTPVVAAILMPISSIIITQVATSWSLKKSATGQNYPTLAEVGGR